MGSAFFFRGKAEVRTPVLRLGWGTHSSKGFRVGYALFQGVEERTGVVEARRVDLGGRRIEQKKW